MLARPTGVKQKGNAIAESREAITCGDPAFPPVPVLGERAGVRGICWKGTACRSRDEDPSPNPLPEYRESGNTRLLAITAIGRYTAFESHPPDRSGFDDRGGCVASIPFRSFRRPIGGISIIGSRRDRKNSLPHPDIVT